VGAVPTTCVCIITLETKSRDVTHHENVVAGYAWLHPSYPETKRTSIDKRKCHCEFLLSPVRPELVEGRTHFCHYEIRRQSSPV
jgi:hypothetical protein